MSLAGRVCGGWLVRRQRTRRSIYALNRDAQEPTTDPVSRAHVILVGIPYEYWNRVN